MNESEPQLKFAADEIESVESFRRMKDTAVLTIMFTDIKGFTQLTDEKGERHSNEVRRLHDEVLERVVTAKGAGIIVKHIGDAVMAVFSEPSAAVERALQIHEGLDELNRAHPELDPLSVRIGLDMGQVTVEESVDLDVFGRHVNRASRVEGLADGGQVFMSYTVFDSARGWLSDPSNERFAWTSHGRYHLKGVSGPVEIFEVAELERGQLRPPQHGKKARAVPSGAWAAGFVLLGVAATVGYLQFQRTEVWLSGYAPAISYLDGATEVLLDGESGDDSRRLLLDVRPGTHVLDYDVADGVRYYAQLEIERGENYLRPEFTESRLPALYRYIGLGDDPVDAVREGTYFFYDAQNKRIEHDAELALSIAVTTDPADAGNVVADLSWRIVLDGETVSDEVRTFTRAIDSEEPMIEEGELYSDEYHRYGVRARIVREYAHLEIISAFLPRRP
jgi:class 3 adenylate cyclase